MERILGHYILQGKKVVKVPLLIWAKWFEESMTNRKRVVGFTKMANARNRKKVHVSTVFLGLDSNFGAGRPILFETMVFDDKIKFNKPIKPRKFGKVRMPGFPGFKYHPDIDGYTDRYSTYLEAERGHYDVVGRLKKAGYKVTLDETDNKALLKPKKGR